MTLSSERAFAVALAHHEAGRLDLARTDYHDIVARDPEHAESWHLLGLITAQQGEPESGIAMIRRAMGLAPARAPHHNSLAAAYRMLGRDAEAVVEYRAAAALRPESGEIHNNLATALRALGRLEEAVTEYRRAAGCSPSTAEIWYNLGSTLAERDGQAEDVEFCFRRAIGLRPDFANAFSNLGRWLASQARWFEAETCLSEAVRLARDDARSWNNLGIARQELGRTREAAASYRCAIALEAGFADAHYNLGCLLSGDGRTDAAVACHQAALAADPLHGAARLALCVARLPVLYRTEAEISSRRADYLVALGALATAVETPAVARAVAAAVGTSQPFFLPYQGRNDREAQAVYGRLVWRVLAETEPQPPLATRPAAGERIRLGIVSGFFLDHTISRLFLEGWLSELDSDRFEVTAFHTGQSGDAETRRHAARCERFVRGMRSGDAWRQAVLGTAPHVLLYPEVGIDPVAARLAAQRLAPVQCVAWGHPETTGMPTLDYFLSAELMEPGDGDSHYTERLVRLPGLGLHYTPDERMVPPLGRVPAGLHPGVPVYWSGQALYKYSPEYDQVFPRIALAVGACRFVFIGFAKSEAVTAEFRARLERAFAAFGLDANRHCVILPPMPQQRFIATAGLADVILDTQGWSGGRSTMDCLAGNPAIVTLPGQFMRGRHTAAILRRIGCEATIAQSLDDYVAIAARLGMDAGWRSRVRRAVAEGKHRAFRDMGYVRALEDFLVTAVATI